MTWSADDARLLPAVRDLQHVWCAIPRAQEPPHVTPLWFVVHDGRAWFSSPWATRKVALLRTTREVSLAFAGTESVDGAVLEGTAAVTGLDSVLGAEVIDAFAGKYDGWDAADPVPWGPRALITVVPQRWLIRPAAT